MKKDKKKDKSDRSSSSEPSDQEDKKSISSSKSSDEKSKQIKETSKNSKPSSDYENDSQRKRTKIADEDKICAKRREIEHSKWDSPSDKPDRKRKPDPRRGESKEKVSNREDGRTKRHEEHERDERESKTSSYRRRDDSNRHRDDRNDRRDRSKNDRRDDRVDSYNRGNDRSRSHSRDRNSRRNNDSRNNKRRHRSRSGSFDHSKANWGKGDQQNSGKDKKEKEKPNFGLSGKLTEETNTFKGVIIKYSEPPEARKPKRRWRLYPFKGEKAMQTLFIHRESAYLIGRDRKVVDLPVDHPSCSKQHAALQYRLVPFTREDGSVGKKVRPYLIDLESANGTYINNKKIDPKKYVELLERDVIKFGYSSREYVLLHENSKDEGMDDDVKNEEEEVVKAEPKE